jgi:hypothetical protein
MQQVALHKVVHVGARHEVDGFVGGPKLGFQLLEQLELLRGELGEVVLQKVHGCKVAPQYAKQSAPLLPTGLALGLNGVINVLKCAKLISKYNKCILNNNAYVSNINNKYFLCYEQNLTTEPMAPLQLKPLLRLGQVLVSVFLLCASIVLLIFFFESVSVAYNSTEVKLTLNTTSPNLFTALHDMKAGWEDGNGGSTSSSKHGLPTKIQGGTGFELTADPQTPLLRYQETSTWKRLALLYMGASNDFLSLAWVIFIGVGSWLLWLLLLDVRQRTPFTFTNARRLRNLGLLILGLDLGQELSYFAVRTIIPSFRDPGLTEPLSHYVLLNTDGTLPGWEAGFMLLIIAAVYQRGVEMNQEAELTI